MSHYRSSIFGRSSSRGARAQDGNENQSSKDGRSMEECDQCGNSTTEASICKQHTICGNCARLQARCLLCIVKSKHGNPAEVAAAKIFLQEIMDSSNQEARESKQDARAPM